jgi:hypothetical protein
MHVRYPEFGVGVRSWSDLNDFSGVGVEKKNSRLQSPEVPYDEYTL